MIKERERGRKKKCMSTCFIIARQRERKTRRGQKGLQSPLLSSQWLQRPPVVPDRDRQSGSVQISPHNTLLSGLLSTTHTYTIRQQLTEFMRFSEAERTWLLSTGLYSNLINHSFPLVKKNKTKQCFLCVFRGYCLWHRGLFMIAASAVPACTALQSATECGALLRAKEERISREKVREGEMKMRPHRSVYI